MSNVTVTRGIVKSSSRFFANNSAKIVVNINGTTVQLDDEQARKLVAQLTMAVAASAPAPNQFH